jgi:fructoselysine-6-P-deglycase FrlB-like protein
VGVFHFFEETTLVHTCCVSPPVGVLVVNLLSSRRLDFAVFGASNSGKTKEVVRLLTRLKAAGHPSLYGLTANPGGPLEGLCAGIHVLACGHESAVAATMSVAEPIILPLTKIYILLVMVAIAILRVIIESLVG